MSNISDLNSYKEAKHFRKELEDLILLLHTQKQQLVKYHKYVPIQMLETSMLESLSILQIYYNKYDSIVKSKGNIND